MLTMQEAYYDEGDGTPTDVEAQSLLRQELDLEESAPSFQPRRKGILTFLKGPHPLRPQTIHPVFLPLQETPTNLITHFFPSARQKAALVVLVVFLWLLIFVSVLTITHRPLTDAATGKHVLNLGCTDTLWRRKNECGLDGVDCRPFSNISSAFRCPAKCADVKLLNPRVIGALEVNYRPLVVGSGPYRGDSFICGAGLHGGIVRDDKGGCGRLDVLGMWTGFESSVRNGIESIPFSSYFPLAFAISEVDVEACASDPRTLVLFLSVLFTAVLCVFSGSWTGVFFPVFGIVFTHVAFISDPPDVPTPNITPLPDRTSLFARRLLPAFFIAWVIHHTSVRKTLSNLTASVEKTVFWLGGIWFGALSNYTFDWLPISRLTAHDLNQQPGAKLALALILLLLVVIIAGQIYFFWQEGRLPKYLALYGLFLAGIGLCLALPGVQLRIHHYILALLLLPGTALQTRPSLLYQGLLIGLFINGTARWGFDSVLQTAAALRGDARLGTVGPGVVVPVIADGVARFQWEVGLERKEGISVLVNDVERYRGFFEEGEKGKGWEWERGVEGVDEFFRFAYLEDGMTGDYGRVGVWFANGSWGAGSA